MSITTVYYVRPGNTEDNSDGRWSSADETPLSTSSIKAAEEMAAQLSDVVFDKVFCSKAERTKQTARIINSHITPKELDCLYEMEIGPFEAMNPIEIVQYFKETTQYPSESSKKTLPKLWARKNGEDPTANECLLDSKWHPKIDCFDDFCMKIQDEITALFKENIGKTILFVGHGTPGKFILSLAQKIQVIELECKKANYFKVTVDQSGDVSVILDKEGNVFLKV